MLVTADRVHTGHELASPGFVRLQGERVVAAGPYRPAMGLADVALGDVLLAPGFVDVHNHGGGGVSFPEDAERAARSQRAD